VVIRFSPSGSYLLVAVGNQLLQFDARSFQGIQSLQFENEVMALGIAADESLVAVGVVNTVYLWSATEDKLMWRVESGATGVTGLAISPGKTRVVVDYSSPVSEVYDLNAGRRLVLKDVMLEAPAFLDEDRIIGGDGTRALHVVSAQDLSVLETIPHPSGGVNIEAYSNELAFDSNGKVAVFRGSIRFPLSELRVWKR
jgi:WD40 repeat protein